MECIVSKSDFWYFQGPGDWARVSFCTIMIRTHYASSRRVWEDAWWGKPWLVEESKTLPAALYQHQSPLVSFGRHYNYTNEELLIIMDTNLKKYPGTIMPPADIWCDDVLFSTNRCCRNQGKNILNRLRSFNVISLSRHQLRGVSSLKRLVLACRTSISRYNPNNANNIAILITLAGARCHKPSSVTGGTAWTVSYNCKFKLTIFSFPLNANWPRWDQHHSAQSEHWDGGTRLSVSIQR